jgi:hypothetical protein
MEQEAGSRGRPSTRRWDAGTTRVGRISLDSPVEPLFQEGERPGATTADLTPDHVDVRAREHALADVIDHRPMEADQGSCDDQGLEIIATGTPLIGDEVDQPVRIAIVDLSLAGPAAPGSR